MDPITRTAGTALVQAIATDAWQQVKHVITGLWHRVHPRYAGHVGRELDELRRQVLRARANGDAGTERALEGAWQRRLHELLRAYPELAADLLYVAEVLTAVAGGQGPRPQGRNGDRGRVTSVRCR